MRTRERQRAPQASTDHYLSGAGIGASLVVEHLPENDGVVVPLVSRGVDQRCITFVSSRRQGVQARCARRGRKLLMLPLLRLTAGTEAGHYLPARHARQPSADYGDPVRPFWMRRPTPARRAGVLLLAAWPSGCVWQQVRRRPNRAVWPAACSAGRRMSSWTGWPMAPRAGPLQAWRHAWAGGDLDARQEGRRGDDLEVVVSPRYPRAGHRRARPAAVRGRGLLRAHRTDHGRKRSQPRRQHGQTRGNGPHEHRAIAPSHSR